MNALAKESIRFLAAVMTSTINCHVNNDIVAKDTRAIIDQLRMVVEEHRKELRLNTNTDSGMYEHLRKVNAWMSLIDGKYGTFNPPFLSSHKVRFNT
jgi:hypothetical protein